MNKSIFFKIIIAVMLIAIPSQGLIADAATGMIAEKQNTTELHNTMKSFQKAVKSFARCAATGQCESEHQKKLITQIGSLAKKLILLFAVVGVGLYVRNKAIRDFKILRDEYNIELRNQKADIEARVDAALAKYKPIIEESAATVVQQAVDYADATINTRITQILDDAETRMKDAAERTEIVIPSVVSGGTAIVKIKPEAVVPAAPASQAAQPAAQPVPAAVRQSNIQSQYDKDREQLLSGRQPRVAQQPAQPAPAPVVPTSTNNQPAKKGWFGREK